MRVALIVAGGFVLLCFLGVLVGRWIRAKARPR